MMGHNNKGRITCKQARELDMVDFLSRMGIEPVKPKGNNFWYYSPFRQETTPSFKINRRLNRWYDFGEGNGGNLIDFGVHLYNCTVREFLQMLQHESLTVRPHIYIPLESDKDNSITFVSSEPLTSKHLLSYLSSRKITYAVAANYCTQVSYQIDGRSYFAIGFANRSGGFELRSEHFKGSISPKDYTLISSSQNELSVFEGFLNFLSYHQLFAESPARDFLILNSLSFFDRAQRVMASYEKVYLYLDNDTSGDLAVEKALSTSIRFIDQRKLYERSNDLNDFLNLKFFR